MTNIISEESFARLETNIEEKDLSLILKTINKIPKFNLGENINLFFDEKMKNVSLCPILPLSKIDLLFQLYNINISKLEIINKIKKYIGEENLKKEKTSLKNGTKIKTVNDKIQIIDEHFIQDCIILSKANTDGPYIIADKITKTLYGGLITYKYKENEENNQKYCLAYLKAKDDIYIESDLVKTDNEAKLNVNKKIILKYLPEKDSNEIINNIEECIKRVEKKKNERKERYEKYLEEFGGDRKLLRNKRKITQEEFSRRLPYFNMLDKDKKNKNNNSKSVLFEDDDDEEYFMNTEELPINEILLGDLGIVDHHLKDFKYTPLKIFEMIRDSEKIRGVDFKIEYSQINDKNYCHNNEVTIFSQKLGIKVQGYGKSREEAENKCALNLLAVIFKNKFKTYCELHEYFENKNRRYLDIILIDENDEKNDEKNEEKMSEKNNEKNDEKTEDKHNELSINETKKNKKKKLEDKNININIIEEDDKNKNKIKHIPKQIGINNNNNSNCLKLENNINIENNINNEKNINNENNINNNNNSNNENNINNNSSMTDSHESLDNFIPNVNNKNMNNNKNGLGFLNNSINNSNSNGISVINNSFSSNNSMTSNKIIEELTKNKKYKKYNNDNYSSSNDSKKKEEMFDESMFFI